FKSERTLTAMQRATAGDARDFTICGRPRRGLNPNKLVLCCAVRAFKLCHPIHSQTMGFGRLKKKRRILVKFGAPSPFGAAALLEHWKSSLRLIVITSLPFIIPICIAPLFLYCTALWIDS